MVYFLYLTLGELCGCYIFIKLFYFEFGLKCMHFFWDVNYLFLDRYYVFVELCYFEFKSKCMHNFWDVKKNIFIWMVLHYRLNIY